MVANRAIFWQIKCRRYDTTSTIRIRNQIEKIRTPTIVVTVPTLQVFCSIELNTIRNTGYREGLGSGVYNIGIMLKSGVGHCFWRWGQKL